MDDSRPRSGKFSLWWFLGNVLAQGVYLSALHYYCRRGPAITRMTVFYVMLTMTGIYVLPTLGYLIMPGGQSRKFDRGFIVWGCVTTFFVSLAVLGESRR